MIDNRARVLELGQLRWTTKKGQPLTYADMDTEHLKNVARLLKHRIDTKAAWLDEIMQLDLTIERHALTEEYLKLRKAYGQHMTGPKPAKVET